MIKIIEILRSKLNYIKRVFRFTSMHFIISSSFAFTTILAMIFVGIVLYNKFSDAAEQNAKMSTKQIIDQVNLNLDSYQKNMMEVSNLLESSINKNSTVPNSRLENQMDVILGMRQDIVALAVFSTEGDLLMGAPSSKLKEGVKVKEQDWFNRALKDSRGIYFSTPHVENLFEGKYSWVVSLSRPVSFYGSAGLTDGVLLVDMNFRSIDELCKSVSLGKRGYIFITDSEGKLIYHPQQQLIYNGLISEDTSKIVRYWYGNYVEIYQREKRLITIKTVGYTGWKIVGVSYMDELVATKREIVKFSALILLASIIIVVAIFIYISAKISNPIKQLESSMKLVEEGRFDITVNIKGEDEVVKLSKAFNLMVGRIRQLMDQIVLEQEAKRKSELNALQAQINPHFLYNTLDSIVWMAENGKSQDVITMVTALARLFRISISRGKNIITVKEELEHARNYLIIQKIRYKNKFRYEINVQEEVLQYKTLKLILQPIIENAIYHGIEYMVDEGVINISAGITDGKLLYEVTDNGLGMKREVLERILSFESKGKGGAGVGVKNVHERIQLCYGNEFGVSIESELEEGTSVKLWLPLVMEDNEEKQI